MVLRRRKMHVSGQDEDLVGKRVYIFKLLKLDVIGVGGVGSAAGKQGGIRIFRLSLRRRLILPHLASEG